MSQQCLSRYFVGCIALLFFANSVRGGFVIDVSIIDPTNSFQSYYAPIRSHAIASGQRWGSHFAGTTNLQLEVAFDNSIPTANGGSVTSSFVANRGGFNIFEQGVAAEVRTGIDPNGASSDYRFTFGANYLRNELWFDTDPFSRSSVVPTDRTDAMSVFLHEFGHALAFNGWQNSIDGTYPGDFKSTFDERKTFDGTNFNFNGSNATGLYGTPVPITFGNSTHLGNSLPRPGADLIPDLMNGVVFFRGTRYDISPLDLAIVADTGLTVISVPEPSSIAYCALTLLFARVSWRNRYNRRTKNCSEVLDQPF